MAKSQVMELCYMQFILLHPYLNWYNTMDKFDMQKCICEVE